MIQDQSVSLPNRRTTTTGDHAERVHNQLANQTIARQAYEQQHQTNIPTRRERMYFCFCLKVKFFVFIYLAETVRLEDQPFGDDQQALLAEFERRRRVNKNEILLEK